MWLKDHNNSKEIIKNKKATNEIKSKEKERIRYKKKVITIIIIINKIMKQMLKDGTILMILLSHLSQVRLFPLNLEGMKIINRKKENAYLLMYV